MRPLLECLHRALVGLLVSRISRESAEWRARMLRQDLGFPDCPICIANRKGGPGVAP